MWAVSDQQSTVAGRYEEGERGVTSLVPRHLSRGVWQHGHTMPCPREIQSITQPRANVCVPMQSKLKVCANAWLDRSINTKNY